MNRAKGALERTPAGPRLRFVRNLAQPPEVVWRALTESDQLRLWFPQLVKVERWEVGARLHFEHPRVPEATFAGEVLTWDPPRVLEFTWGTDLLRFELEPHAGGSTLTMLDTFAELGKAARDGAGWHVCLDQLRHVLEASSPPWGHSERWREVHPVYARELGPEATSIGPPPGALE